MTGEKFELEVYDGDTVNATKLTLVNQWTGVNQAITPVSSSGHAIYIRFRYSGRNGASVNFMLTDERGRKRVQYSYGSLLGRFSKISDKHPCYFYGSLPGAFVFVLYSLIQPLFGMSDNTSSLSGPQRKIFS